MFFIIYYDKLFITDYLTSKFRTEPLKEII